jgi:hypothetical protein
MLCQRLCYLGILLDTDAFTDTLYNSLRGHLARHGSRPR